MARSFKRSVRKIFPMAVLLPQEGKRYILKLDKGLVLFDREFSQARAAWKAAYDHLIELGAYEEGDL